MSLKRGERLEKIYEVVLSDTAIDTFEAIFDQISTRWSERIAKKFETKVFRTLDILSKKPLILKEIDAHSNVRKGLIDKNCSFFYEVSPSQIQILFFWDNRQEPILD